MASSNQQRRRMAIISNRNRRRYQKKKKKIGVKRIENGGISGIMARGISILIKHHRNRPLIITYQARGNIKHSNARSSNHVLLIRLLT